MSLPRPGPKRHCGFNFALSWIGHSRRSQLPCREDMQAAPQEMRVASNQGFCSTDSKEVRPSAKNQLSLQMTRTKWHRLLPHSPSSPPTAKNAVICLLTRCLEFICVSPPTFMPWLCFSGSTSNSSPCLHFYAPPSCSPHSSQREFSRTEITSKVPKLSQSTSISVTH